MGLQSMKVPQPEFSRWVIERRQALDLSQADLKTKIGPAICERTLKYLEDGKKNSYSEYTLNILATGLDLSFPELLTRIREMEKTSHHQSISNSPRVGNMDKMKFRLLVFAPVFLSLLFFSFLISSYGIGYDIKSIPELMNNHQQRHTALQDVLIHPDYSRLIVAYDREGNTLWQKDLKTRVRKVAQYDLDNNGSKEIIAGTWRNNSEDTGELPGWLYVWNVNGDLLAEFNTWQPAIYPAREPRSNVVDFQVTDLENDGVPEIIVAIRGEQLYPPRLAVLHFENSVFKEVKSYWNPGYLLKLYIEDINNDGFPEIICTCVNNDLKRVKNFSVHENLFAIFLLDGRNISGQAPPYLGQEQPGSEVWYRYVSTLGRLDLSEIADVTFMGSGVKEIHVKLRNTCFFYLNGIGDIVDSFKGDHCTGDTELTLF